MGVEIERKFLVNHDKWAQVTKPEGTPFRQGYILSDDTRTIRVRTTGKVGYITIKGKSEGISRKEYEYEIPETEGNELLDNFALSELKKIRYCIDFEGKVWEVDVFLDANEGLITAEIELDSETEKFTKPDFVTEEVSEQGKYYNSSLSTHPFMDW
jgi:adenylate cyclase